MNACRTIVRVVAPSFAKGRLALTCEHASGWIVVFGKGIKLAGTHRPASDRWPKRAILFRYGTCSVSSQHEAVWLFAAVPQG